jgi:hypothetical protein
MLDATEPDGDAAFGPIFVLDDVNRFFAERPAALRARAGSRTRSRAASWRRCRIHPATRST